MAILIFGHKNPDTDSVAAAITLANLKNQLGEAAIPHVIGNINKETQFVLNYFGAEAPKLLRDVKTQVSDLNPNKGHGIAPTRSILHAYRQMVDRQLETLPILDEHNKLLGIVSMKDIAMGLIKGDYYSLTTSFDNLIEGLSGTVLAEPSNPLIAGKLSTMAFYYKSIEGTLSQKDIVIVGDRYDIIEYAISAQVQLIIVTGNKVIPEKYIQQAKEMGVPMLSVPYDTYYTSKIINQCSYVSKIMRTEEIIKFNPEDYLDEVKDAMGNTHFRNYPVVEDDNTFVGFINRKHIMNSGKKQVILVDHNEYSQSVDGLKEAEILEIIDHHKLGDISTSMPIYFRNIPVGSTCTIIYQMYRENSVAIDNTMAGLLISGILSDTLYFKSPTTTPQDIKAVEALNEILQLDLDKYAMDMFTAGTSLEGQGIEEIFHKDFKEFVVEGNKIGISQVFTLDIDGVFSRKEEFMEYLSKIHRNLSHDITLLLITDILKEGSYLLYETINPSVISQGFGIEPYQGVFLEKIVSRKKQVVPKVLHGINMLK